MSTLLPNGALVLRIWGDGPTEILAKFQYFERAKDYAEALSVEDDSGYTGHLGYLAVSEDEAAATFFPNPKKKSA